MIGLVLTPGGDRTSKPTHPGWRLEQYSHHGRVEMSRPNECTECKIAKTIHRRNSNGHRLGQLCTSPSKNEILTRCWFIVGAALQTMASYRTHNCEGRLCSPFEKYCLIDIVT